MSDSLELVVLLCCHNGVPFIEEQLDSIAAQTRLPDHVAIHDWGSSDGTRELIRTWIDTRAANLSCELILHEESPGPCKSFLEALESLLQDWPSASHILFCDQDDLWMPGKVEAYENRVLGSDPRPQLLFSDCTLIDGGGAVQAGSFYKRRGSPFRSAVDLASPDIALVNPAIGMTLCVARPLACLLAEHRAAPWSMHDWAAVILSRGYRMRYGFLSEPLAAYRQHAGNAVGAPSFSGVLGSVRNLRRRLGRLIALRSWALGLPPALRDDVLALLPVNRWDAARRITASANLRYWYRLVLVALVLCFWSGRRRDP